jgi:hypothetical protein
VQLAYFQKPSGVGFDRRVVPIRHFLGSLILEQE